MAPYSFRKTKPVKIKTRYGVVTYVELADILGVNYKNIRGYIYKLGVEAAIDRVLKRGVKPPVLVKYKGVEMRVSEVENITGFSYTCIYRAHKYLGLDDIGDYLDSIIAKRNLNASAGDIKRESERLSRVGKSLQPEFARCKARSN